MKFFERIPPRISKVEYEVLIAEKEQLMNEIEVISGQIKTMKKNVGIIEAMSGNYFLSESDRKRLNSTKNDLGRLNAEFLTVEQRIEQINRLTKSVN